MRLVVGLGNPEARYLRTRHNLGWRVVDALAEVCRPRSVKGPRHSLLAAGELEGHPLLLAKPLTYMNRSGLAVVELLRLYAMDDTGDLMVVCDDVNLPLGSCRIRREGSCGGHNGLRSIEEELGTPAFPRMRLGVADAAAGREPLEDYVLKDFPAGQAPAVEELIAHARQACRTWAIEGIQAAIAGYNRRINPEPLDSA